MLYSYINEINKKSLVLYIVIIIVSVLYFNNKKITLGTLLGIFSGVMLAIYLKNKDTINLTNENTQHDIKLKNIHPSAVHVGDYREITDFIFSIQDMYIYNPPAFEEMIVNIDKFFGVYKEIMIDSTLAGVKFSIINKLKHNTLNSLHSIIFMLPANKILIHKHENAIKKLDELLNVYLNRVYNMYNANLQTYGYDTRTPLLDTNMIPNNFYEKNIYTYEFM